MPKTSPAPADLQPFSSGIPVKATAWMCMRQASGKWVKLSHPADDGVDRHQWPIEEASIKTVRARWGIGTYKIIFHDDSGQILGKTKDFTLRQPEEKHPKADPGGPGPTPAAPTLPPAFALLAPSKAGAVDPMQLFMFLHQLSASERQQAREMANETTNRDRQFLVHMTAALRPSSDPNNGVIQQLAEGHRALGEAIKILAQKVEELAEEEEEPDDDEEPLVTADGVNYAAAVNKGLDIAKEVGVPLVQSLIAKSMAGGQTPPANGAT
jgi:hypothetical protein